MNKILFATSNLNKLNEAREILQGIKIEGVDLKIDEIQSLDSVEVATKKARGYYEQLKKPLFVDDNALVFEELGNKLPGAYIGDFSKALNNEGLIDLIKDKKNRNALARVVIVFIDQNGLDHSFVGEVKGTITNKPRGENGFGWDSIFIPSGFNKTYAEMTEEEKNSVSMRKIALHKFKEWLDSNVR